MKTAMQQLLDKIKESIQAGQDIEKLIPMLSNQYLEIERQQLEDAFEAGELFGEELQGLYRRNPAPDKVNYFKTTYNE